MECCSVCLDPSVALCSRLHREVIVIRLADLKTGDLLLRPEGKLWHTFLVVRITKRKDGTTTVATGQRKDFELLFPELPILVKREVRCNWPRCELHCGKCMRYAEEEQRRDELLQRDTQRAATPGRRKAKDILEEDPKHTVKNGTKIAGSFTRKKSPRGTKGTVSTERPERTSRPVHSE